MTADPIVIYALKGSQFVAKVLAAVESRGIAHYVQNCPLDPKERAKFLPTSSLLVPQLKVGSTILQDSEAILLWFDEHHQTNFYPSELAGELSRRASDAILAASVWYYNWVDDAGYDRSLRTTLAKAALPSWLPFAKNVVDLVVGSKRQDFRDKVGRVLPVDLDDEAAVRGLLVDELVYFQSQLKQDDQLYLVPGTIEPTAADVSVYAQVNRLVGDQGAYDASIPASLPAIKERPELGRLWKWHDHMCATHKVHFLGKSPPKSAL